MHRENAIRLIKTGKLTATQIRSVIKKVPENENRYLVLISAVNSGKFTTEEILEMAEKEGSKFLWEEIAKHLDFQQLSLNKMLEIGRKAKCDTIWRLMIENIKMSEISFEERIRIAEIAGSSLVWLEILEKTELTVEQLFEIGEKADSEYLWEKIIPLIEKR